MREDYFGDFAAAEEFWSVGLKAGRLKEDCLRRIGTLGRNMRRFDASIWRDLMELLDRYEGDATRMEIEIQESF